MKDFYKLIAKGQEFDLIIDEDDKKTCFEYSEAEEMLKTFLDELSIKIKPLTVDKYFADDEEARQILEVTLTRTNKKPYVFKYGMSLKDSWRIDIIKSGGLDDSFDYKSCSLSLQKFFNGKDSLQFLSDLVKSSLLQIKSINKQKINENCHFLYDVLSSLSFFCPIDFQDFCDEFGYDNDSIKAKKTFKKCLSQESNLQKLFSDEERSSFPQ
jgi:hypothetical protein